MVVYYDKSSLQLCVRVVRDLTTPLAGLREGTYEVQNNNNK